MSVPNECWFVVKQYVFAANEYALEPKQCSVAVSQCSIAASQVAFAVKQSAFATSECSWGRRKLPSSRSNIARCKQSFLCGGCDSLREEGGLVKRKGKRPEQRLIDVRRNALTIVGLTLGRFPFMVLYKGKRSATANEVGFVVYEGLTEWGFLKTEKTFSKLRKTGGGDSPPNLRGEFQVQLLHEPIES